MALIYAGGGASGDYVDGLSTNGWEPWNYLYGSHITIPSSGTVTQMGSYVRCHTTGDINIKFGLYDSGGTLIVQSTATVTSTTLAWVDSGAVSGSVSAGTYYVLISSDDTGSATNYARYGWDSAGNGSFATQTYVTAMAASETITVQGDTGQLYGVRADFTAGGGGGIVRQMMMNQ